MKVFAGKRMLTLSLLASVAGLACGAPGQSISKVVPRKPAECVIRGGLPNFFKKCREGKTVFIAYFGGSITQQPGWRVYSMAHFKKLYPKTNFVEIQAAIGGTNSTFGVFRMDKDVLAKKPDLVFVEFSVNDFPWAIRSTRLAMEGIVRKIWKNNPACDICFVYTITLDDLKYLKKGESKPQLCAMEEIADHYSIPSVDFAPEVYRLFSENKLVFAVKHKALQAVEGEELNGLAGISRLQDGRIPFSEDGVHPYPDTGHKLYQQILARSLTKMKDAGKPGAHAIREPLWKGCWDAAQTLAPDDPHIKITGKHAVEPQNTHVFYPGATLEFKFKGSKVSLYEMLGPKSGSISVKIDNRPEKKFMTFDRYSVKYNRAGVLDIADYLDPAKVHTVKITVRDEKFDKRKIILKESLPKYDKNPENYAEWNLFIRAVYVVGEIH